MIGRECLVRVIDFGFERGGGGGDGGGCGAVAVEVALVAAALMEEEFFRGHRVVVGAGGGAVLVWGRGGEDEAVDGEAAWRWAISWVLRAFSGLGIL